MAAQGRWRVAWGLVLFALLPLQSVGQSVGQSARQPTDASALEIVPVLQVDGAERAVQLRDASIQVELDGALARTVLSLEFFNPNSRDLEGRLQLPLAPRQQVAGFALDIDGAMRDAVPVPKEQGRAVFEQIQRRRVDPGLLEQVAGNVFQLRVHPIPAHGSRRVRIELREDLAVVDGQRRWRLPTQPFVSAARLQVELRSSGAQAPLWRNAPAGTHWTPDSRGGHLLRWQGRPALLSDALHVDAPVPTHASVSTGEWNGRHYVLAQIPVPRTTLPRRLPQRVGVLWDASASGAARDHGAELALLDRYLGAIGTATVDVTVLRNVAEAPRSFSVRPGDWTALRRYLLDVVYDGGTDLGAWTPKPSVQEYLLFSDGQGNLGRDVFPVLPAGVRLYTLSAQSAGSDAVRLAALAEAAGGRLLDLSADGVDEVARQLLHDGPRLLSMAGKGIDGLLASQAAVDSGWLQVAGWSAQPIDPRTLEIRIAMPGQSKPQRVVIDDVPAAQVDGRWLAGAWAGMQLRQWRAAPGVYRARSAALAREFGIVDAQTSLIVLEDIQDYVRHRILPPPVLRAAYARALESEKATATATEAARLETVVARFRERQQWWRTDWAARAKVLEVAAAREQAERRAVDAATAAADAAASAADAAADATVVGMEVDAMEVEAMEGDRLRMAVAPPSPPAPPAPMSPMMIAPQRAQAAPAGSARRVREPAPVDAAQANAGASQNKEADAGRDGAIRVQLAPWQADSDDARRLHAAPADAVYPLYLQVRERHAGSTAFVLDVADILIARGQRDLGVRVLSNLAEMQLEDRHVLRVLGYRLLQAGEAEAAVEVLRHVLRIAGEEPQSHRDLGLALEAAGRPQEAMEALYDVVRRPWDARFDGIALIALDELNTLVAREGRRVRTDGIDPRLLEQLPLDLRVVLSWDSDNSDMDLWVTDPDGERAYYGNRLTRLGGQMSQDFTGGYGPEQFSLRHAKPGVYKVEANFFGERQPLVTGATTLSLRLSTGWGGPRQQDQSVILRLKERTQTVLVGEFTVEPSAR